MEERRNRSGRISRGLGREQSFVNKTRDEGAESQFDTSFIIASDCEDVLVWKAGRKKQQGDAQTWRPPQTAMSDRRSAWNVNKSTISIPPSAHALFLCLCVRVRVCVCVCVCVFSNRG